VGHTPRSVWLKTIAVMAGASLALTACGSSNNGTTTSATSSNAAAPTGTSSGSTSGSSGSAATSSAPVAGGTGIVTAVGNEPQNPLIPTNTTEVGGGKILDLIFSGLVYYDADGKPQNEVADSITSSDGQNYDIKLKSGWTFTNGEPVTAASYVDAWNYGALVTNSQLNSTFFDPIEGYDAVSACGATDADGSCTAPAPTAQTMSGLKVVSDTEFTVKLVSPQSDFPLRLGYSAYYPMAKAALADIKTFGETPAGNGPYKIGKWDHNSQITLVPNPDYKGGRTPQNGGITFIFYTNSEAAYTDLLADNVDVIDSIPSGSLTSFESDLGDRAYKQPYAGTTTLSIPVALDHFKMDQEGKLRRMAISAAIDRDSIVATIFNGTRTPAKDFTSPGLAGYSDTLPGADELTYNEQKAKDLWAQADAISPWSGTFKIGYNADASHKDWVEATVNSIKNTLGIDAEPNPIATFGDFRSQVIGGTLGTASRAGWQADYPSIYNFLGPLYAKGAGSNDAMYDNPDFDALLVKGASATSVDAGVAFFQQAEALLFRDLPAIPLWYSTATGGFSTKVSNVKVDWHGQPIYYAVVKE
jgi:oligopeptide transport system substrate-binding protein